METRYLAIINFVIHSCAPTTHQNIFHEKEMSAVAACGHKVSWSYRAAFLLQMKKQIVKYVHNTHEKDVSYQ